jgi:hypothetical protein
VNSFSGVRESGHRDEHAGMRVAQANAMVAREQGCEYILRADKMRLTTYAYATSNSFSLLCVQQPSYFCVSKRATAIN